ncbi:DUF7260 family protein [Halomicrobium urmianum]|uniref:DUF7260 family protein n=1 Tax=Halomicrobium urmianum TaxID=1586233 RepID=UPI00402B2365
MRSLARAWRSEIRMNDSEASAIALTASYQSRRIHPLTFRRELGLGTDVCSSMLPPSPDSREHSGRYSRGLYRFLRTSRQVVFLQGDQQQFEERVEDILSVRQSTLNTRPSLPHLDRHDLCECLYSEESWTYPVLIAARHLLNSIAFTTGNQPRSTETLASEYPTFN